MPDRHDAALQSMIRGLGEKTGRTIQEWVKVVETSGLGKHGQIVAFLKEKHGVTHGYANLIAHSALKSDAASVAGEGVDLVAAQYAGAKAATHRVRVASAKDVDTELLSWLRRAYEQA